MRNQTDSGLAIVVGAADIGSATAVALYRAGHPVVLCDDVDPSWPRRGMAFTNAWYIGSAELDEVGAVFCASVRSIPTALARSRMIVATTWSWAGVAAALPPAVVVHAYRRGRSDEDFRAPEAPGWVTIGIGPGFVAGGNVDVVVESAGATPGTVIRAGAASSIDDEAWEQDALTESVRAPVAGRFTTGRRIGTAVLRGETIGAIGLVPIAAPVAGVLRGLTARGARVTTGMRVAEIDPRGDPVACFGISKRSRAIARGVLAALDEAMSQGEAAEMAPLPLPYC